MASALSVDIPHLIQTKDSPSISLNITILESRSPNELINNNEIYFNPIITPNFYFAKIIQIETEASDFYFPKTLIKLSLHHDYGFPDETILSSIIHPTEKAEKHFLKFVHTFLNYDERDVCKAQNRWGSIWVYDAEYNETQYSAVKFVWQPNSVKMKSIEIFQREREEDVVL